jgi:UDPglucose 6-dehydrogenase
LTYEENVYQAVQNAHAIVIATEWAEFKTLDYAKIFTVMEKPAFIFDGRNIVDRQKCFDIGFNVYSIGAAPLKH